MKTIQVQLCRLHQIGPGAGFGQQKGFEVFSENKHPVLVTLTRCHSSASPGTNSTKRGINSAVLPLKMQKSLPCRLCESGSPAGAERAGLGAAPWHRGQICMGRCSLAPRLGLPWALFHD